MRNRIKGDIRYCCSEMEKMLLRCSMKWDILTAQYRFSRI